MGLPKVGMRANLPTAQNRQRLPLPTSPFVGEGDLEGNFLNSQFSILNSQLSTLNSQFNDRRPRHSVAPPLT